MPTNVTLRWECSDPDGDSLRYEIYSGFREDNLEYVDTVNEPHYTPPSDQMKPSTTYYWKVVAIDEKGAKTKGPAWSFTTVRE